jgi:DNA polymerase-4
VAVLPDLDTVMRQRLDEYQLELIGEIAAIERRQLSAVFGSEGVLLHERAHGIDLRPVLPPERRAEFRVAHTLATDTNDLGVLSPLLRRLTERLGSQLRFRHLTAARLTVALAYSDYATVRRQVPLNRAALDMELWDAARRAFALARQRTIAIRAVGVTVDRLTEEETQLQLELGERDGQDGQDGRGIALLSACPPVRLPALQGAIDKIRKRWGDRDVITAGSSRSLLTAHRSPAVTR